MVVSESQSVAGLQLVAETLGLVSVLARGLLAAPAVEAVLEAEWKSGVRFEAGSSPESAAELEIPLSAVAAAKAAAQLGETSWGRSQVAVSLAAAAAVCADSLRSAREGLSTGHTAVDSVSAQSAVQSEEWEAFHLVPLALAVEEELLKPHPGAEKPSHDGPLQFVVS